MTSSRLRGNGLPNHLEGRFRVVAYDQRGHGESAPVAGPMALERGVRDAENVAASLGEPVDVLLGHSWGGAVAILAGARLPVARVAAIDPMIRQVDAVWYDEYLDELRELFALTGERTRCEGSHGVREWAALDVEAKVHAVHAMTAAPIRSSRVRTRPSDGTCARRIARYEKPLLLAFAHRGESINDDRTLHQIERD